jgi:hypothetical protein
VALRERGLRGAGDSVFSVPCNPRMAQCTDPDTALLCEVFNAAYGALLLTLQELYAQPDKTGRLNSRMYALMEKVLSFFFFFFLFFSLFDFVFGR